MTRRKKQAYALLGTAGVRDQASEERFAEISSGRIDVQPGPTATGIDLKDERKAEPTGGRSIWRMSQ